MSGAAARTGTVKERRNEIIIEKDSRWCFNKKQKTPERYRERRL